jgi:hypothetical protein
VGQAASNAATGGEPAPAEFHFHPADGERFWPLDGYRTYGQSPEHTMPDDTTAVAPSDAHGYEHDASDTPDDGSDGGVDQTRHRDDPGAGEEHRADVEDADDVAAPGSVDSVDHTDPADSDDDGRARFRRLDGADDGRVDEFLKERVAFTAREWAIARLCADFRTGTGVEMTRVGERLPDLVPFMDEPYAPGAVSSTRRSFREKVRKAAATFLYGAYADFLTAEEVDDVVYEATEVAKFLIEVEGGALDVDDELSTEDRVREAMRAVHEASLELRYDRCPHCGEELGEEAAVTEPA